MITVFRCLRFRNWLLVKNVSRHSSHFNWIGAPDQNRQLDADIHKKECHRLIESMQPWSLYKVLGENIKIGLYGMRDGWMGGWMDGWIDWMD